MIILFSCNSEEDDILGLELIDEDEFVIEKHTYVNRIKNILKVMS
mgnify:CR=1 FL=1